MILETLLGAFLQVLFDRLATRQILDFFRDSDFDRTLFDKLKTVLLTVSAVLTDAEEKQITNLAVKGWLNELRDAVYHADDLLDEINTITLQAESEEAKIHRKQLPGQFSIQNPDYKHGKDLESKLKMIVERLESLAKENDLLNLKETVGRKPLLMFPTTSLVDESEVFGRDKDKDLLIKSVLAGNAQQNRISVIAIVGIGGLGKTTLAQLLYNDSRVKTHFRLRAWVHVSEEFDVFKVSRIIFESITSRNCNVTDLNVLQVRLKEILMRKRFLLVLDDIWNENFIDWDLLLGPLKVGANGSKILVTTRNRNVASLMRPLVTYPLLHLSDEDCWSLFAKHAFRTSKPEEHPILNKIGREIVKKCRGLPLAAKTLGGILHPEVEVEGWHKILNSKIWDLPNDKSSILPALLLSYYHLPPHLKRCFAYCSIIPNGREFEKEKLILMWMAEGFLQQPKGKDTMEDVGEEYFSDLVSRSFFQPRNGKQCFVMHDLIIDLAQFVSGEFCCKFEDNKPCEVSEKARHLSCSMDQLNGPEKFVDLQELRSLRSFLPLRSSNTSRCTALSNIVSDVWLQIPKQLRVVSFSGHSITELPDILEHLIHLRYLDLSHTLIRELPRSTCSLYNLQTLLLSSCHNLTVLPENIGDLVNLRHLDVTETSLREMPLEFGRLKSLQVLTDFVVSRDCGSKISELGNLSHLCKLSILRLQNVVDAPIASAANLGSKNYIKELVLKWTCSTHDEANELAVLDCLQPHKSLRKLTLENYGGIEFPNWVGDAIFTNMVSLSLSKCKNCTSLPPLGKLSSLQKLYIKKMEGLERLDSGFYGSGHFGVKPFRSLKTLSFEELPHWTHWMPFANEAENFPSLQELQIRLCPELIESLPKNLHTLTKLVVSGCYKLQASAQRVPTLEVMQLHGLDALKTLPEELLEGNFCFQLLELVNCPSLISFPGGASLSTVKSISISHCRNLQFFLPENTMHRFEVLERLRIANSCDSLESLSLGLFTKLQYLHIEDCKNLKSLFIPEQLCLDLTFLREMKIKDCPNLKSFLEGGLPTPNLQSLIIMNCNNLKPKKEWGLHGIVSLTCLEIEGGCRNMELFPEEGLLPNSLTSLRISRLPDLETLGKGLQDLTSLEILEINCCEKLESMPAEGFPTSLFSLHIQNCSLLAPHCQKDGGVYWPMISHIADLLIPHNDQLAQT
ncbi:putative disease resistance RPP13-like protein 1 [Castanea sativa]|uniref:putative disease resistance RPP13-like protein 1 n=1 Tax=Castanea sativa TaxID=21020 RepID=UPI003F64C567